MSNGRREGLIELEGYVGYRNSHSLDEKQPQKLLLHVRTRIQEDDEMRGWYFNGRAGPFLRFLLQFSAHIECRKQHEISKCVFDCPPETTCHNRGSSYYCLQTEDMTCKDRCVCEDNYYRNEIGECVTEEQCVQCSGPNEYFTCGSACDNVCSTLDTQNQIDCPVVSTDCKKMCYCVEGTARNDDNVCVPIEDC